MYLMTPEEAARVLKVATGTLRRWLRQGTVRAVKTPAGWRLTQEDLNDFIQRHRSSYQTARPVDDDDDAYWAAEGDAALDRLARGEEQIITLEQWEARHGLGG